MTVARGLKICVQQGKKRVREPFLKNFQGGEYRVPNEVTEVVSSSEGQGKMVLAWAPKEMRSKKLYLTARSRKY